RYEEDLWTYIARFLDGKSLVKLSTTCKWFNGFVMHDSIWKFACIRDLQVPAPTHVAFNWINLYASAFDGSHSYLFRQQDKHIDWMRIGAFFLDSPVVILTDSLCLPMKISREETTKKTLESCGTCLLKNIKTGIWIADLQLVRCPVCEQNGCDGTMQTLDARHIELFLCEGFQDGSWEYDLIGSHQTVKNIEAASGAIFNVKRIKDRSAAGIFNLKSWIGRSDDWQPKAVITFHSVAVNTNLQENEGLLVKYHAMKAGTEGEIVSIRISQQLL
ncbi:hypothetical protein CFOL_v3_07940, partial [Cephalotus follicularis]